MNINDSNRHFEKLSSFYQQISADGNINRIELDLLKSYTRKFYEAIASASHDVTTTAAPVAPVASVQQIEQVQAPVASLEPKSPPKAPAIAPISPKPAEPIAEQAPAEVIVESSNEVASGQSKDMDQLFSLEHGTEISDKLSKTAISDINKAMSINERIFTIKELFGGNKDQFDKTISSLNGFVSYDDATKYLADNVVNENNWLEASKSKKVKNFLKLISRKYD